LGFGCFCWPLFVLATFGLGRVLTGFEPAVSLEGAGDPAAGGDGCEVWGCAAAAGGVLGGELPVVGPGGFAAIVPVAGDAAWLLPSPLVAVTSTRTRFPTNFPRSKSVDALAPALSAQVTPPSIDTCH
jgi:hypothetical protein